MGALSSPTPAWLEWLLVGLAVGAVAWCFYLGLKD